MDRKYLITVVILAVILIVVIGGFWVETKTATAEYIYNLLYLLTGYVVAQNEK